jgi:hypothetical protein
MLVKVRGAQHDHNLSVPNADPTWTVLQLKEAIVRAHSGDNDLSVDAMRLIFAGRVMTDTQTLQDFGIQDEQTVHMVVRPPAQVPPAPGANGPSPGDGGRNQQPQVVQGGIQQVAGPLLGDLLNQFAPALNQIMPALAQGITRMVPAAPQEIAGEGNGGSALPAAQQQPQAQAQVQAQAQAQAQMQAQMAAHQQAHLQAHLHHQNMMLQQAARANPAVLMAGAAPPMPAVQVHVHVSLTELDDLPARLQSFYQRMAPAQVTVRVEQHQQPQQSPPAQQQPQQQTAGAPTNTGAQRQAPAAAAPSRPVQQQPAPAVPAAAPPAAASEAQPRPNLSQLVAAAGLTTDASNGSPASNLLDALEREVMNTMEIADLMRLMGGDWSPILKARPAVTDFVKRELAADSGVGNRQRLAAKTAKSLVTGIVEHIELRPLFLQRQKPNQQNIFRTLENGLYAASLDLIQLFLEEPVPASFTQKLRLQLVRFVGATMDYFSREVLVNGLGDLDVLVQALVRAGIQEASRQNAQLAAFAPMAGNLAMNTLVMWRNEYMQVHRRSGDDAIFTTEPRVPPLAAPAAPPAAAGPAAVSIDDLLDEALDAQPQRPAGGPAGGDAASALRTSLQDTSLTRQEVEGILAAAQDSSADPSSASSSELCAAAKGILPR